MKHLTRWFAVLAVLLVQPVVAYSQTTGSMAPIMIHTFLDSSGNPLDGCLVDTYLAGGTTPVTTYSNAALSSSNANPVVCDSAGSSCV